MLAGPSGASVREVMRQTGADIKSWTEQGSHRSKRPARVFLISVSALRPTDLPPGSTCHPFE
jgi:hypothetical protein